MKNVLLFCTFLCIEMFFNKVSFAQNTFPSSGPAGIGTLSPNSSSLLDVTSTTKGVVFPRMTKNQRDAITAPVAGLLIYQTTNTPGYYYFDGTSWKSVSQVRKDLSNLNATAINESLKPNADNTLDLGSAATSWRNQYLSGKLFLDDVVFVDNTGGGVENTFLGNTGNSTNTGFSNTATGYRALFSNTTGGSNTATGSLALTTNSSGSDNTALGYQALYSGDDGSHNTAVGSNALYSWNPIQYYGSGGNTAVGAFALYKYNNQGILPAPATAIGAFALYNNVSGEGNNAVGNAALYATTGGRDNCGFGGAALSKNTLGSYNTAVGNYSGDANDNSSTCTYLGYDADQSSNNDISNSMALGNGARISALNNVRIGNSAVSSIGGYAGWSDISDGRYKKNIQQNVPGLEFINALTPVTYTLDVHGIAVFLNEDNEKTAKDEPMKSQRENARNEKEKIVYTGFIAQEVEKVAMKIGYDFSGVDKPQNENSLYGLRYAEFVVPLVKAVQELSSKNDQLASSNEQLISENKRLETKNEELDKRVSALENQSLMTDGFTRTQVSSLEGDSEGALLGQNIPNPFDNSTLIPFRIPKNCNNASIMITNTSTSQVISVMPISCHEDHLSIEAGVLASGTYSYTLYVDGKMIDTRSMQLVR